MIIFILYFYKIFNGKQDPHYLNIYIRYLIHSMGVVGY